MIDGNYIAGFTDGEGCFTLLGKYYFSLKDNKYRFRFVPRFQIRLKKDDYMILTMIRDAIGVGAISMDDKFVVYATNGIKSALSVIEFFDKYSLHARKKKDFEVWKEMVLFMKNNKSKKYNREVMNKLLDLRELLNRDSHTTTRKSKEEIMNLWKMNPYGGTSKSQDKKIETCVNTLLASGSFNPKLKEYGNKSKKQAAIRICKNSVMKKK